MARVAVNIVTWNSAAFIPTLLESLAQQTFEDFSVMVVDNASTDATLDLVDGWTGFPIEVRRNRENVGFAPAHNTAIHETDGEFVLPLNPDIYLTPTFVECMVAAADARADAGSVAGKLLAWERFPQRPPPEACLIDSAGLKMLKNRRQYPLGHQEAAAEACLAPAEIFGPDGAAPLYRRAMLEDTEIDGQAFSEVLVSHKEDVDLAWRAQLLGWKSVYTPDAVAYHVRTFRPGKRSDIDERVKRQAVANRWLVMLQNELWPLTLRHLPHIASYELGILVYMLLFERSSLAAFADVARSLRRALSTRRTVQQRRRVDWRYMAQWFE